MKAADPPGSAAFVFLGEVERAEALGEAIFTVADSLEELNEMVRDAVICHFDEMDRPKIIRLHFVREEVIAV